MKYLQLAADASKLPCRSVDVAPPGDIGGEPTML
jgi:hypothetical protein